MVRMICIFLGELAFIPDIIHEISKGIFTHIFKTVPDVWMLEIDTSNILNNVPESMFVNYAIQNVIFNMKKLYSYIKQKSILYL